MAKKQRADESTLIGEDELRALSGTKEHEPTPHVGRKKVRTLARNNYNTLLVILLPMFLLIFILALYIQQERMVTVRDQNNLLEQENAQLHQQVQRLESENLFYKKAYEITLDDIRTLSSFYGGEEKYDKLAEELRQEELGTILGANVTNVTIATLKNAGAWQGYLEKGIISTSCMESVTIDTITDDVLLTIPLSGNSEKLALYLDGNLLTSFALQGAWEERQAIQLPSGPHEIAILSKAGDVKVTRMLFDTINVPGEQMVVDLGTAFQAFDCKNATVSSNALSGAGAVRVLITKK